MEGFDELNCLRVRCEKKNTLNYNRLHAKQLNGLDDR